MSRRVVKKPQAKIDLLEHFVFIGENNLDAADRFLQAAEAEFRNLADMPGMGRRWASPHDRLRGIRVWPIPRFKNYLIFYRPIEDGIEVLHVLHGARDIQSLLDNEDTDW